jgi:uncharacterized protein HemY
MEHLNQYWGVYICIAIYIVILFIFMRFGKFMADTDEQIKHWSDNERNKQ